MPRRRGPKNRENRDYKNAEEDNIAKHKLCYIVEQTTLPPKAPRVLLRTLNPNPLILMAQIIYRRLDKNGEPMFGAGLGNFVSDREAVAQAILTRIKLLQGEWWESLTEGTPLFQSILGQPTATPESIAMVLQERIAKTPFVSGITNIAASEDKQRRASFSCNTQTDFGAITITTQPGSAASISE